MSDLASLAARLERLAVTNPEHAELVAVICRMLRSEDLPADRGHVGATSQGESPVDGAVYAAAFVALRLAADGRADDESLSKLDALLTSAGVP